MFKQRFYDVFLIGAKQFFVENARVKCSGEKFIIVKKKDD